MSISCLYLVWLISGLFFFFKQKTAYEMRISDWSSDVCSSDLAARRTRDDRDAVAEALGVRHDMGRKENRRAALALAPDQHFQPLLVDRVEPRKGLVEHDQVGRVDDRSDQLHHLRHAFRHLADLFVDHAFAPQLGHEVRGAATIGRESGRERMWQ